MARAKTTKAETDVDAETEDEGSGLDIFQKQFVVGINYDTVDWEACDHLANVQATIQDVINTGFRVAGDVTFDGAEADPIHQNTTLLNYSVEIIPAGEATGNSPTPSSVGLAAKAAADQEFMDQGEGNGDDANTSGEGDAGDSA